MTISPDIVSQLSGCSVGLTFPDNELAKAVITALSHCDVHHGIHHFAVVGEGQTIVMSETGRECIRFLVP